MPQKSLSPRLHDILGIEVPIIQSGMGGVAGPDLAAAVCNAGALGVIATLRLKPDQVRSAIAEMRSRTNSPFGVNIWLHEDVRRPVDPTTVSSDAVRDSQSILNEFRPRFELPLKFDAPPAAPDLVDSALEVMIEERIPVFCAGVGTPEAELVERFHRVGTKVVSMIADVSDATDAVANGVDALVAQGSEAGGHRSYGTKRPRADAIGSSTMTLVPEVIDAIDGAVPVLAAGGVVDGRGLAAMLVLGADGVLIGTRFVATVESQAAQVWKDRLTGGNRNTVLTDGFSGQWASVLESEFTERWAESGVEPLPALLHAAAGADLFGAAKAAHDDQLQPLYAGAGVGRLDDIPSAADVVSRMVSEARSALQR